VEGIAIGFCVIGFLFSALFAIICISDDSTFALGLAVLAVAFGLAGFNQLLFGLILGLLSLGIMISPHIIKRL
jgi:hypothetical protein